MVKIKATNEHYWLALAFLAVFVNATHATQEIAFEWKPGLSDQSQSGLSRHVTWCHVTCQTDTSRLHAPRSSDRLMNDALIYAQLRRLVSRDSVC